MDLNNAIFNNNQIAQNNFQGQNGMNPMNMNTGGMDQMGMNQMNMNQMGMNPMNMMMNNPLMAQMLLSQMNMNQMGNMSNNAAMFMNNNNNSNNQQQNNGNNNLSGNSQQDFSPEYITITFIKNNEGAAQKKVEVQCTLNDKVEDVINKYRSKANDYNKNEKFIFNAKRLNLELSVSEAGLLNNSKIFVMITEGIVGGK